MWFKIIFVSFLMMFNLALIQCGIPPEFADFRGLTDEQKHEKFKKLPLDKQVDFHLVMMRFHPPDTSYAFDIADNGKKTLPYLIERLETEQEDYRKVDIIYIFKIIQVRSVDLRKKDNVLLTLRKVVGQMNNPVQKEIATDALQFIEGHEPKYK